MRRGILLVLFVLCIAAMSRDLRAQGVPGPSVFVSTQQGGQILRVTGNTGVVTVISSGNPFLGVAPFFYPEGMVVGPDGKLYIADPSDGLVVRMNLDGSQTEMVYDFSCDSGCPGSPQAPSFSSSATGDLYFNTRTSNFGEGVWAITGVGTTPFGGTINAPVNIVPGTCTGPSCFTPGNGAGTAFDSSDNLLFVNQAGGSNPNSVLSVSSPYASSNPISLASGLHNPTAIALNPATGALFVSDTASGDILAAGTSTVYFAGTAFGVSNGNCAEGQGQALPELPLYMQFDETGHLFVVTAINSAGNCGEIWRIDPPTQGVGPLGTMLVDLVVEYNTQVVTSDQAVGIALAGTPGQTQSVAVSSVAGSFNMGWPVGCNPNLTPSNCTYTFGVTYPSGMFPDGSTANVFPSITSQAAWALRTPAGNPYNGSVIAPVAGENGAGTIFSATCVNSGSPCVVPDPTLTYTTATTWKSLQPNYCGSGPGLLKADPIGADDWINTLNNCTVISPDPTYGARGKSTCSSSSCLSDWSDVFNITGTAPVVTVTTPASGATYFLNQVVVANYSCTPAAGTSQVTACAGTVANGSPIDTSSVGTKTFSATADVSAGPAGAASTSYQVVVGAVATVSPTSVSFGNVLRGGFPIKIVTVTNTGNATLNINSVKVASVSGGDSDDFLALNLCLIPLQPAKSCVIFVSFFADADDFNPQSANLTITDNATNSPQVVPMTATVVKRK